MSTNITTSSAASLPAFANKELQAYTNQILALSSDIKHHLFAIAWIINEVDKSGCYQMDGFSSVHMWTESCFGYKKSQSYAMLRIGSEWTEELIQTGKTGKVKTIGYAAAIDPDYSTTQIQQMFPVGRAMAQELHELGKISPSMSAAEIKRVIKAEMSDSEPEPEEEQEELDAGSGEAEEDILIHVEDDAGVAYEIPASVLYQYRI